MEELPKKPLVRKPIIGEKIYVPSSFYVFRGKDDFEGGLATINEIEYNKYLPKDDVNYVMVSIEGQKGVMRNWKMLLGNQEQLKKDYKGKIAHASPDLRPEFNDDEEGWR